VLVVAAAANSKLMLHTLAAVDDIKVVAFPEVIASGTVEAATEPPTATATDEVSAVVLTVVDAADAITLDAGLLPNIDLPSPQEKAEGEGVLDTAIDTSECLSGLVAPGGEH